MMTKHNSPNAIVPVTILAVLGVLAIGASVQAAELSLGYGGDGVWRQAATANSQRWFRCEVTWDTDINDDGVPNERIDALYLNGISYSGMEAAPSGRTYAEVLGGGKGIWGALELAAGQAVTYNITITGTGAPSLPNRLYYTGYTPAGGYTGYTLTINIGLAEGQAFTVSASGVDMWGRYYLDVVPNPTVAGVCQILNITTVASETKFYYTPTVGPYATNELTGLTIHFDTGAAAGETREIETNAWDGGGYYITVTEDLPDGLQQTLTLESTVPAENKVYYSAPEDVSYAAGSLIGQFLDFPTQLIFGQHTIVDNGFDPAGNYIQVDTSLPADLLQTLTVVSQQGTTRLYYSGATHSFNQLVGAGIEFTSGAALGERRTITANYQDLTGTYIDVDADLPAGIVAGDTFDIKDVLQIEDQCHIYEQATIVDTRYTMDSPQHFGVAPYRVDDGDYVMTVGPFSNYHSDYLVGTVPRTSPGGSDFYFRLEWSAWNADEDVKAYEAQDPIELESTQMTVDLALRSYVGDTVWPSGEMQAWYSGHGTGVDPLVTTRSVPGGPTDPDNGCGSDEYTFRIKYFSGIGDGAGGYWPEMRSQWWRHTDPYVEFGEEYTFVNFNLFAYYIMKGYGTNADPWMHNMKYVEPDESLPAEYRWTYGPHDDPHRDLVGDVIEAGGEDPEAILIVDGQYNRPHYMLKESGDTLRNGIVYKYIVRPTNYLQFLHNIFTLQYDTFYRDAWDIAYWTLSGEPTSNAYVSMRPGGHTYEFLTCRDWDPPVWGVGGGGTVGSYAHAGPCPLALRGMPGRSLEAAHVVNEAWYFNGASHTLNGATRGGPDVYLETVELWNNDEDPGGYGYPYDSQDPNQYPKVDPVLTAHPYFEDGPLSVPEQGFPVEGYALDELGPAAPGSEANPFNPLPSMLPAGGEPWGDLNGPYTTGVFGGYGGSQHSAVRFTNEDTIWPNYVNINPETVANPFRGGKWTMDTTFMFRINYWQSDNLKPQSMQFFLRQVNEDGTALTAWQGHSMSKVYPTDNTYTDGCLYYYEASTDQLPGGSGDYQYRFQASDGQQITIYPNRPSDDPGYIGVPPGDNDYYWFRVNNKPQLADQSVTPSSGTQGDPFVYEVTYYDDDGKTRTADRQGDRPFKSILHIDLFGDAEGQAKVAGVAGDVITYEFDPAGGTAYADNTLVGMKVRMQTGDAASQQFDIIANDAAASTITVTGISGVAAGDLFNIADWYATTMVPENASDTNYRDGAVHIFNTARAGVVLDKGTHHYYFEFWDNWAYWIDWQQYFMDSSAPDPIDQKVEGERVRFPQAGYFEGPEVMVNTAPILSAYFFAPPDVDEVAAAPVGDTFEYVRPGGLPGYPADALAGMYVQMRTGVAQFQSFQIDSNTTTQITVAGGVNLVAAGVAAGNQFRVFADRNGDGFLSWDYDTDTTYEGTPATPFRFYVTYTDTQNNSPSVIRVQIDDGETLNMTKVLPADTTYADGCEYVTIEDIRLSEGIHTFKAQASDGSLWYNGGTAGNFFGPIGHETEAAQGPDIAPNTEPGLGFEVGSGVVSAVSSATSFIYTDGDSLAGDPTVAVDFGAKGKFRVKSVDHDTKTIVLRSGADLEDAGVEAGDSFTATVELDPTTGLEDTAYTYWVVYSDTDNYGGVRGNPPSFVKVFIDNQEHLMEAWDALDTDMTDGKIYHYSTSALSASQTHSYYFMASDGLDIVRLPAAGFFSGPSVNVNNPPVAPPETPTEDWLPPNGVRLEIQTPTLDWPEGSDPDAWDATEDLTYIVQLSTTSDFATVDYEYDTTDYGGPGVTQLEVPDTLAYSWWYWQVQTVDTHGLTSAWSEIHNFKVDHAPGPPTSGFSPDGPADTQTPTLQWDPGTDEDADDPPEQMYYHLELDDDSDFSSPIISPDLGDPGDPQYGVTGQGVTSFEVDASLALALDTTYSWHVRTLNGLTSEWSVTQTFEVVMLVYSISGTVTDENGDPLPGVTIEAYNSSDNKIAEAVTGADGTYELTGLPADTYRIAPSGPFTFSPTEEDVTLTDSSVTGVDFQLVPGACSISGTITLGAGGPGIEGVNLNIATGSVTTDANGDYTITGVPNGDYTVTPTLVGYAFDPPSRDVTVVDGDITGVDFTAIPETYTVSGTVTDYNGDPLANVQVTDGTNTATTDAAGQYSLSDVQAGTATISASRSGYVFDPVSREITVPDTLSGVDFVGYPAQTEQFPAGVNLIGVPVEPFDTDPETVFGTDQVARWDPQTSPPYGMPGDPGSQELLRVQPGCGFFVNFAEATDLSVGGTPVRTDRAFTVTLEPLWNMVANPFLWALPMANIQPTNPGTVLPFAFVYDNQPGSASRGSYLLVSAQPGINIARTNLQPWEGAWLRTTGGTAFVEMTAPSGPAVAGEATMKPQALEPGEGGWIIPVVARVAGRCDLTSAVGVAPAVGTYTVPNPPRVSGSVDVYFVDEDGRQLAQAIKPAMTEQVSWDFVVTTDIADSDVDVALPDLSQVPHNLSVILTDLDTDRSIYARTCPKYTFRSGEQGITRHLRLQVAPRGTDNLVISTASAQPTGQSVVVTYAVTKPCEVTIQVMNISGRIIKTLAADRVVTEGVNTQIWNLRSAVGTLVPGGVYLLQIRAVADNGQQVTALRRVNVAR